MQIKDAEYLAAAPGEVQTTVSKALTAEVASGATTRALQLETMMRNGRHHLDRLAVAVELRRYAEQLVTDHVGEARAEGVSWNIIGAKLKVSAQAAHKKYR